MYDDICKAAEEAEAEGRAYSSCDLSTTVLHYLTNT